MEPEKGRVYIIDDDAGTRHSMSLVLNSVGHDVKTYSTAEAFLEEEIDSDPHCLIVELLLPGMTGLKLCREISTRNRACGFVVVTGNGDISTAVEAMRMGAVDFLEKPFHRLRLLESVYDVLRTVRSQFVSRLAEIEALARMSKLTLRERDVFAGIAAGLPTKTIAANFGISVRTVDVHRSRITHKLGVESAWQLAHFILVLNRKLGRYPGPVYDSHPLTLKLGGLSMVSSHIVSQDAS
jgi:two-component system, LuxR family, response regulator FixJ